MRLITLFGLMLLSASVLGQVARDVPKEHWAYEAVESLATKGLVKGYPAEGNFFGKRTVTRYEMATIVQRVLTRVDELLAAKADKSEAKEPKPTATDGVSKAELDEVRKLVSEFKIELVNIGADLIKVKAMIGDLNAKVEGAVATAGKAATDAADAKKETGDLRAELNDLKEGFTLSRVELEALQKDAKAHKLSGYIQARFEGFDNAQRSLFPAIGTGGTGQTPTNGGPRVGGPAYGALIRRARLKLGGPISNRADYTLQLDVPSTGAVALKDAYVVVNDLPLPDQFQLTVGQFAFPFGIELPASSSTRETPERALGFSDSTAASAMFLSSVSGTGGTVTKGSVVPLWLGQDRDNGAMITYSGPNYLNPKTKISLGLLNGDGRGAGGVRQSNQGIDAVVRAQTSLLDDHLDIGISGYYGTMALRGGSPVGGTPVAFVNAYRMFGGADVRYISPWGTTFRAEWMGGLYESTPDRAQYLKGNHAQAWYLTAKHPLSKRLDFAVKYDEFMPIAGTGVLAAGLSRHELTRKTIQGGFLYYLDDATRLRLWYARGLTPYDASAAAGSPLHQRLGLITTELQITY